LLLIDNGDPVKIKLTGVAGKRYIILLFYKKDLPQNSSIQRIPIVRSFKKFPQAS